MEEEYIFIEDNVISDSLNDGFQIENTIKDDISIITTNIDEISFNEKISFDEEIQDSLVIESMMEEMIQKVIDNYKQKDSNIHFFVKTLKKDIEDIEDIEKKLKKMKTRLEIFEKNIKTEQNQQDTISVDSFSEYLQFERYYPFFENIYQYNTCQLTNFD